MNIINTTAPIALDDLKKYFENKETRFIIDYQNSELQGDKLLTYLGNLDLPCDVVNFDQEFVSAYLTTQMLVNIPSLETVVISMLGKLKMGKEVDNREELLSWERKIDSLTLYNMYSINSDEMKSWVKQFPEDDTKDLTGINFISLLKNEDFYLLFQKINTDNLTYFSSYFDEYMFKGNNLFYYWANENNPMFLLTWAIASDNVNKSQEAS
jgi:hypothetical protein